MTSKDISEEIRAIPANVDIGERLAVQALWEVAYQFAVHNEREQRKWRQSPGYKQSQVRDKGAS